MGGRKEGVGGAFVRAKLGSSSARHILFVRLFYFSTIPKEKLNPSLFYIIMA